MGNNFSRIEEAPTQESERELLTDERRRAYIKGLKPPDGLDLESGNGDLKIEKGRVPGQ